MMDSRRNLPLTNIKVSENYYSLRQSMRNEFINSSVVFEGEYFRREDVIFFNQNVEQILNLTSKCLIPYAEENAESSEINAILDSIKSDLHRLISEVNKLIHLNQDDDIDEAIKQYNECIKEMRETYLCSTQDEKKKNNWKNIFEAMEVLTNRPFLECIICNRILVEELNEPEVYDLVQAQGYRLLREINRYRKKSTDQELPTVRDACRHASDLLNNLESMETYQAFANSVEGSPCRAKQALGYTMIGFGATAFFSGLMGLAVGTIITKPTLFIGLGVLAVSAIVTYVGEKIWQKGKAIADENSRKGLSKEFTLFGKSVKEANRGRALENAHSDSYPLVHRTRRTAFA